jgi:hypothetical protein
LGGVVVDLFQGFYCIWRKIKDRKIANFLQLAIFIIKKFDNEQGLWQGGGFETRLPERLPI